MKVQFKYGKDTISVALPRSRINENIHPVEEMPGDDPFTIIRSSLKKPVGGMSLSELIEDSSGNPSIAVTVEDHTRPVPLEPVIDPLLDEFSSTEVPKTNITFLVATGIHRDLNKAEMGELRNVVGPGPKIVNHHADNQSELTSVGGLTYPDGTKKELLINSNLVSADITVLTGDVEFHQLYGYGGGAKSILPGTADAESVRFNHSLMDVPEARSGNLNNPLREAAEKAADLAGVNFSVNLVLNQQKEIVNCYSGNVHQAFRAAVENVGDIYKVPYERKAELVIVEAGGYPKDIDLYQSQKAVENGLELVKPGGDLILIAKCQDGWGSSRFYDWVSSVDNLDETEEMIREKFVIGGHKAYIYAKEKRRANLFLISDLEDDKNLRKIFTSITVKELEEMAKEAKTVAVLKLGSSTIPVKKNN